MEGSEYSQVLEDIVEIRTSHTEMLMKDFVLVTDENTNVLEDIKQIQMREQSLRVEDTPEIKWTSYFPSEKNKAADQVQRRSTYATFPPIFRTSIVNPNEPVIGKRQYSNNENVSKVEEANIGKKIDELESEVRKLEETLRNNGIEIPNPLKDENMNTSPLSQSAEEKVGKEEETPQSVDKSDEELIKKSRTRSSALFKKPPVIWQNTGIYLSL